MREELRATARRRCAARYLPPAQALKKCPAFIGVTAALQFSEHALGVCGPEGFFVEPESRKGSRFEQNGFGVEELIAAVLENAPLCPTLFEKDGEGYSATPARCPT